jgi:hypothetical protein
MRSLGGVKVCKNVLIELLWRHLAKKLWAPSLRSMVGNGASRRGYNFDPEKIFPKPHGFGVATPRRSFRITSDLGKNRGFLHFSLLPSRHNDITAIFAAGGQAE